MSQENVEIVRQGLELLERGELDGLLAFERGELDAVLDLFTDDVIVYRADPDGATYAGKAGFLSAVADWTENFSEWRVLPPDYTDLGEHVLARVRQIVQGRSSGVRVESDIWFLFELTDTKVSKLSFYTRRADALEAAGLPE